MHAAEMTATEIAQATAAGQRSVETTVRELLERVEARETDVCAWQHLDPRQAVAAARALDAGARRGLLYGVPFGAKDNFDSHDMPTGYGSAIYAGSIPPRDAAPLALMRLAGALLLGKTVSTEFAHRHPGPTRNPCNPAHTPGGSSSGSAAAVAAGMVPVAFGTQTTGSVIRPAAYCGVVGYKPTFGDISCVGVLANTPSFDTVGIMARSVDDLALVRAATLDGQLRVPAARALAGLRVALCRTPAWDRADAAGRDLLEQAGADLERHGAVLSDLDEQGLLDTLEVQARIVSGFEFARTLAHERLYALDRLSAVLRDGRMADGLAVDHAGYRAEQVDLERKRLAFDAVARGCDVILTLPAPGAAPAGLEHTGDATFNQPWTTLHTPAVTLPVHRDAAGMPLGIQLVAGRGMDAALLDCAKGVFDALCGGRPA